MTFYKVDSTSHHITWMYSSRGSSVSRPEAVEVEAWSSSGWTVCRSTRSISITSIHWLSSFFSSAKRCWVAIFSRASRSMSCSYSFSFRFSVWKKAEHDLTRTSFGSSTHNFGHGWSTRSCPVLLSDSWHPKLRMSLSVSRVKQVEH